MAVTNNIAEFVQFIDCARPPLRADRSGMGTLPVRGYRFCEPLTSATAFGWWAFSPTNLQLMLTSDEEILWRCPEIGGWLPLDGAAQFPDLAAKFDSLAPDDLKGLCPPFLTSLQEPGMIQVWTGLMARTQLDWSLLIRQPANLPSRKTFDVFEGIIETDQWPGPIFVNLRLVRQDYPIMFSTDHPIALIQPIPRSAYSDAFLRSFEVIDGIDQFGPREWEDIRATAVRVKPNHQPGRYSAAARRRRRGEEAIPTTTCLESASA